MTFRLLHGVLGVTSLVAGCADIIGFPDYKSGSTSAGAGGSACMPGSTRPCYSGPMDTEDVGACHAGVEVCKTDGSAFGACTGERVPAVEDCTTSADEDCDGEVNQAAAGCACRPGETVACYEGAEGTEGVGPCASGTKVCKADGKSYDACVGQVLPSVEVCSTPGIDESCDGLPSCTGPVLWAKRLGGSTDDVAYGVAAAADGSVVVVGAITGMVDLGGGALAGDASRDAFVLKLDAAGGYVWSKRFGDASAQTALAVAIDAAGNIVVVGEAAGAIDLGGDPLPDGGGRDVFVVKLDPTGKPLWSKRFGDANEQSAASVAIDAAGDVVLTGSVIGTINFGGAALAGVTATDSDIFVAKLAGANGDHVWSKRFGDAAVQNGTAVALDSKGDVFLTGINSGSIDFGDPTPVNAVAGNDTFLAKLNGVDGSHAWSKGIGGSAGQSAYGLATTAQGDAVLLGQFNGTTNYGGGPVATAGLRDVFLAKLAGTDGSFVFGQHYGDASEQFGRQVAVDDAGNIVLLVGNQGTIDLGKGPLMGGAPGIDNVALGKLDSKGVPIWSKSWPFAATQTGTALATDRTGNVIVVGSFAGTMAFVPPALVSAGGTDIFIAKLAP